MAHQTTIVYNFRDTKCQRIAAQGRLCNKLRNTKSEARVYREYIYIALIIGLGKQVRLVDLKATSLFHTTKRVHLVDLEATSLFHAKKGSLSRSRNH